MAWRAIGRVGIDGKGGVRGELALILFWLGICEAR